MEEWDDCDVTVQADMIGFVQTLNHVRGEETKAMMKCGVVR